MAKIVLITIGLFIAYQIINNRDGKKIAWVLAGLLFFPHSVGLVSQPIDITFHRLFIYTLLIHTIITKKSFWLEFKKMPGWQALTFVLIANLITGLLDSRLGLKLQIYRPVTIFIEQYLVFFLAYLHTKKLEDTIFVYRKYVVMLIIFGLYGISNYFTRTNEFYNLLESAFGSSNFANANMTDFVARFRVSSFAFHALLYGLIIVLGILVFLYLFFYYYPQRNKYLYLSILLLFLINLLLVNSRTPLICLVAGFAIIYLFVFNNRRKLELGLAFVTCVAILGVFMNNHTQIVYAAMDVFTKSDINEVGGSSIEMRMEQLQASLELFYQKPFSGNGFQYIGETLGYKADKKLNMAPEELRGIESHLFKLLIEQGAVGIIANMWLFSSFIYFLVKQSAKRSARILSLLTLSMLMAFLIFIIGTGALNSFPFFMILLGVSIKGVQLAQLQSLQENKPVAE